ncbi:hypothetical protein AB9K26_05255 [Psychroserpens sp. XS_ASV72]|uniref:hypothetical protein n=1 Tax=Psychroserpens sp. XS_ASV72 TaxID=3241293 RepID=UPI0035136AED
MTTKDIQSIIKSNKEDIAFVIGNGINRYAENPNILSWDALLMNLWKRVSDFELDKRPNGISSTEFYDILELENTKDANLQKEVTNLMQDWEPLTHHQNIISRIQALNAPILTTNFEETLAKTFDYKLLRTTSEGFTDFYPWTTYHGRNQLQSPTDGFGIWYINGMINYHRSIRLGLSHYMGSVERARNLLHKGKSNRLFSGKNPAQWKGRLTWLHILFNKSLFIFGLSLEENETFLRWLLIERMLYFKKFPERQRKGWYLTKRNESAFDEGKHFFLERVGFQIIEVDDYTDIYKHIWN